MKSPHVNVFPTLFVRGFVPHFLMRGAASDSFTA
jgi:hypothetical protein